MCLSSLGEQVFRNKHQNISFEFTVISDQFFLYLGAASTHTEEGCRVDLAQEVRGPADSSSGTVTIYTQATQHLLMSRSPVEQGAKFHLLDIQQLSSFFGYPPDDN